MSNKANNTLIGSFVVGAFILATLGVIIFGGGRFFTEKVEYVMFFDGSVTGLHPGAAVSFRGVRIGKVKEIQIRYYHARKKMIIPVFVEVKSKSITQIGGQTKTVKEKREMVEELIQRGLRAQLQLQSLVTGQLFINLDFLPDEPIELTGIEEDVMEIPTIPGTFEDLTKKIKDLPLKELMVSANKLINDVNDLVVSPETKASVVAMHKAMVEAEKTLKTYRNLVSDDSKLSHELATALSEFSAAARALRLLSEEIEKEPSSVIFGKTKLGDR